MTEPHTRKPKKRVRSFREIVEDFIDELENAPIVADSLPETEDPVERLTGPLERRPFETEGGDPMPAKPHQVIETPRCPGKPGAQSVDSAFSGLDATDRAFAVRDALEGEGEEE